MLATPAKTDVLEPIRTEREPVFAGSAADDDLRPARGIILGMGLGLFSIGAFAALLWWLL